MKPKLQVSRVSFSYHSKNRETLALSDISFNVDTGALSLRQRTCTCTVCLC